MTDISAHMGTTPHDGKSGLDSKPRIETTTDSNPATSLSSSPSNNDDGHGEDLTTLDRRIRWKRDLLLVPILGMLYMILFLDRTNISNARALGIGEPNGLEASLRMPENGYSIALSIFYIPFILAEIPANLVLNHFQKKESGSTFLRPGVLLGGQLFILGAVAMCQGLTASYGGLLAVRFVMGVFEAALPAGASYIMSTYYTKREVAVRFAWFFNFALIGPIFSGLLAYAIAGLEGRGGLEGWRWIFIIEGLFSVALSGIVVLACPNFPEQAQEWFLSPRERRRLVHMLEESRGSEGGGAAAEDVPLWKILIDWRIHLFSLCFFCCDITASSMAGFAPTILTELGWTNTVAQLMTMPIWGAGIAASLSVTWVASRVNMRTPFALASICMQLVGWIIMRVYVPLAGVRYAALFFMSVGTFPQMPILMGWLSANLRGRRYLAVGMAWMTGFGNTANFISANVFFIKESPHYPTGFSVGLAFTCLGFVLVSSASAIVSWQNKKRDAIRAQLSDDEKHRHDELYFRLVQ